VTDDAALYEAWCAGQRDAGAQLVDRYLAAMSRFFANKVAIGSDVEDLVATTFERCARSLGTLEQPKRFRSYLYGIAANVLRDSMRKRRPEPSGSLLEIAVADVSPSPSAVVARRQQEQVLLGALRAIPIEHQIVLELSLFENMSRAEVAEALALPEGTVASRTRRARTLLLEQIERSASTPQVLQSTIERLEDWAASVREVLESVRRTG